MIRNGQQGIVDGIHWFAAQDNEDPTLLHITLHDENGQNIYYDFRIIDSGRFDMMDVINEYKEWLNSQRIPGETSGSI